MNKWNPVCVKLPEHDKLVKAIKENGDEVNLKFLKEENSWFNMSGTLVIENVVFWTEIHPFARS